MKNRLFKKFHTLSLLIILLSLAILFSKKVYTARYAQAQSQCNNNSAVYEIPIGSPINTTINLGAPHQHIFCGLSGIRRTSSATVTCDTNYNNVTSQWTLSLLEDSGSRSTTSCAASCF